MDILLVRKYCAINSICDGIPLCFISKMNCIIIYEYYNEIVVVFLLKFVVISTVWIK